MSQLVLASQSPRRIQLLEKAGFSFTSIPISTSEFVDEKLHPDTQILSITRQKLEVAEIWLKGLSKEDSVVIVSDTEVMFQGKLLGKPRNKAHSAEILRRLSGNIHFVKTAVIVKNILLRKEVSHLESSLVQFRTLSDKEIAEYVETDEGMDKAGAYGIQGLGQALVEFQRGSMNNIIGFPIEIISPILRNEFQVL
ncbi:MAG: septum formation protein Maf [Bdellovibrionaceae bacterium]|nr:septum formation protein Maf [Pseudobdellovibrionaceae bacterium]